MRAPDYATIRTFVGDALMTYTEKDDIAAAIASKIGLFMTSGKLPKMDRTVETVLSTVATFYGVTIEELKGRSRKREVNDPRKLVSYILSTHTTLSLEYIGHHLDDRDHSTIIHHRDTIMNLIETDRSFREVAQKCITFATKSLYHDKQQEKKQ